MTLAVFILLAYLLGSISFGVLASWFFHLPDPRTYGSRNPGATNVLRSGKKAPAVFTLLGDAGKGWLAVELAQHFAPVLQLGSEAIAAVALAVFLGHLFPVFLRFRGGKGVATALGVLLAFNPWMGLLAVAIWITVAAVWRFSSLAALAAAGFAPVYAIFFLGFDARTFAVFVMSLLLIWRHKSNIAGLIAGNEPRIGKRRAS
ncbi:glycerol-3-phosphate 1-O-acyltransferase PlsY [Nitrosospira briensis]|uniref:Glycerol-3-phosphate acyltransferase n=1 Tax=Nitrosospira briensis TaxID=35799 RepID=A0A1I5D4U8_9PROT|nr:glycerol-3-phosphate 1-O-acyltransferase PlsY [Nitrosospira briensis]SFN94278.1 glycerol-3-phosphate acyltransferase PlsY [Nitrosospira briensis]SFO18651.1 acyl-phosphate glycerol-3-phosphate acyltransferase [Nitrosospira briensis]